MTATLSPGTRPATIELLGAHGAKLETTVEAPVGTSNVQHPTSPLTTVISGSKVDHLYVGLRDEAGRRVELTAAIAKRIFASWNSKTSAKVDLSHRSVLTRLRLLANFQLTRWARR